jgi:hypothetical protein
MNPLTIALAALSFFIGMFGYVLTYYWLRPVIGYRKVKNRLAKDMMVSEKDLKKKSTQADNVLSAFKPKWKAHAAALTAVYEERLPDWYKLTLSRRGESPTEAAKHLMALVNIKDPRHAAKRMAAIKTSMKLE